MSSGRFIFRSYAFQSFVGRPWALAGSSQDVTTSDSPRDGWKAEPAGRVFSVAENQIVFNISRNEKVFVIGRSR